MKTFIALLLCFFVALPASAQRFVKVAANTNELVMMPVPDIHPVTLLRGYVSSNENLNAFYQYVRTSTATPNGISILQPTFGGGIGRYHLLSMPVQYFTNLTIISTNTTVIATSNLVLVTTNISFVTTNAGTNMTWTFITPTETNVFYPTNLFVITNSIPGIGSSTDNALVRWDGTTGRLIQDSVVILTDAGALTGITTLNTGQGANELYPMDQAVRAADLVTFGGITNTSLTVSNIVFTDANKRLISGAVGSGLSYDGTTLRAALNGGVGAGISNYVAKWNGTNSLTNSIMYDTGLAIGIGTTTPSEIFQATGNLSTYHASAASGSGYLTHSYTDTTGAVKTNIGMHGVVQYGANERKGAFQVYLSSNGPPEMRFTVLNTGALGLNAPLPEAVGNAIFHIANPKKSKAEADHWADVGHFSTSYAEANPIALSLGFRTSPTAANRHFFIQATELNDHPISLVLQPIGGTTGINTSNSIPIAPLTVGSDTNGLGIHINAHPTGGGFGYLQFMQQDGTTLQGGIYGHTGRMTFIDDVSTDVLTITNARVGIRTLTPTAPLTVQGGATGHAIDIHGRVDSYGFIQFLQNDGTTLEGSIYGHTNRITLTDAAGADVLTITNGRVGIGTLTPDQTLAVNGGVSLVGFLTNTVGTLQVGAAGGAIQLDPIVTTIGVDGGASSTLRLNSAVGTIRDLVYRSAGVTRWALRANAAAESGSVAGSDFVIIPFDDAGAQLATAVTITRASGNVTIPGAITNASLTASSAVFSDANKRLVSTGLVTMAQGGTGVALTDPGADKLFGWDDTGNTLQFFNIGAGLVYDAATDTLSSTNTGAAGGDFVGPASATDEAVVRFDGVTGKLGQNSVVLITDAGAVTGVTTLNTGQGAYELFAMDQDVLTTSAPTFVTVNTGQGANELFDMDQNVQTTDTVTFGNLTVTTGLTNSSLTINSAVFTDANKRLVSTGLVSLALGGTANALADPASNMVMGWDDTENLVKFFIIGAGLNYDQATDTLTATTTGGDVVGPGSATDEAVARFDGTTGKLIQNSAVTITDAGAIAGVTTLNTGNGANELFAMDQNVRTTDAVVHTTVDTGQGANELFDMNQNVQTSDSPSFVGITLSGSPATVIALNDFLVAPAGSSLIRLDAAGAGYTSIESAALVTGGLTNSTLTASKPVFTDANKRLVSTGTLGLDQGGTGASLSDPGANRLLGWDDTDNATKFLTIGSGLSYDAATDTLSSTGLGGTVTGPGTIGRLPKWTGATALGDSIISESAQVLTLNGGASTLTTSAGTLTLQGAGQDVVTLGDVGIGTVTPIAPLTVKAATATGAGIDIVGRADSYGFLQFMRADGTTLHGSIYGHTNRMTITDATGADVLTVTNGKVAIGTLASSATLTVAGTASISGSITNADLLASSAVFTDVNKRLVSTGTTPLSQGGTQTSMADPNANRIMGWDDTENIVKFFVIGTGLSYDQATDILTATGTTPAAGNANEIQYNDGGNGFTASDRLTFDSSAVSLQIGTVSFPGILRLGAVDALHNTGTENIFLGNGAGNYLLSGQRNAGIGGSAFDAITSGSDNTAIGHIALTSLTSGQQNVGIGAGAGDNITTGVSNTVIGAGADLSSSTGSSQIVIGAAVIGQGNNTATIGGTGGSASRLNVNAGQAATRRATVGGTIHVDTTTVGNVGTGIDDLMTFTVPGQTMAVDHDRLVIRATGTYNTASPKDVAFSVGGTQVFGFIGTTAAGGWTLRLEIIRTGATACVCIPEYRDDGFQSRDAAFPTVTFSGDFIVKMTGSATSNNDIVQNTMVVEWHPAPL